jgi:hypothetical protein
MDGSRTIGLDEPVQCAAGRGPFACKETVVGARYCDHHRFFVDTLTITTSYGFGWRDRLKILFGWKFHSQHPVSVLVDRNKPPMGHSSEPRTWLSSPFDRGGTVGMISEGSR